MKKKSRKKKKKIVAFDILLGLKMKMIERISNHFSVPLTLWVPGTRIAGTSWTQLYRAISPELSFFRNSRSYRWKEHEILSKIGWFGAPYQLKRSSRMRESSWKIFGDSLTFWKKKFKIFAPTSCVSKTSVNGEGRLKTSLFSSKFHALSNGSYESSGKSSVPEI